ncbi:MAG: hypothetical protein FWE38_01450 [Firmicutes bacterium]|nr:hypothetical protein [Bacillota bacterium]
MTKCPFVLDYKIFERVEIKDADELLREYNDFYVYNQTQYRDLFTFDQSGDSNAELDDQEDGEVVVARPLVPAPNAVEHFTKLFGSKDFAESCFTGLKIGWYDLQQILLEEFRTKTPAHLSAMNSIAPRLRAIATVLLFAEYMHTKVEKMRKEGESEKTAQHNQKVDAVLAHVTDVFPILFEKIAVGGDIVLPEYNKSKNALAKLKTPEAVTEFIEQNLKV